MSENTEEQDQPAQTENDPVDEAEETAVQDDGVETERTEEQLAEEKLQKLKDSIAVETEEIGTLRQKLTVTVPRDLIEERLDEQFIELQQERDVRGFRRGRAPRRLVEKAFGSEVREVIATQLVAQAYESAVERQKIQVLGEPDLDLDNIKLPDEGDLQFSCEIEVKPEFELPELTGIPVQKPAVTVTDEDVDLQIERLRMRFGRYDPVEDGEVQEDDLLVADVKLTAGDKVISEETNAQFAARPSRIEGIALEDLGKQLAGAKVQDERTVEATVPDDHENEELRGKPAQINFKIHDIKRQVLPPLDDDFAQLVGLETVSEVKAMVRAESESRIDQEVQRAMRAQIRGYLAENTELQIPPGLSSRQTERVVQQRMVDMQRQGIPEVEIQKRVDELRTTAKEQVANEIKMFFILEKLAEEFDVDVSEDEINGQVAQIAQGSNRRFDRVREELMRSGRLQSLYVNIRDEKCVDRLLDTAKISDVTPEQAEEEAEQTQESEAAAPKRKKKAKKPIRKKKAANAKRKTKKAEEGEEAEDDLADET